MADRILTKGLKTGTGVGGVKYILRRGLISAAIVIIPQIDYIFGAMAQSGLVSVSKADPGLNNVAANNSTLSGITILE